MQIKQEFRVTNLEVARSIVRAYPFATLVTAGLRATHMPCLVEENAEPLTILSHVAHADPVSSVLEEGSILAIFQGPHGYVSASWYARETIPTWNHLTLHVRGRPEIFDDPMPVLKRTVEHFEAAVEQPWSLDRLGVDARQIADQVMAFRLQAEWWHAEAKLSQDKPDDDRARVLSALERRGAYQNAALAAIMRSFEVLT